MKKKKKKTFEKNSGFGDRKNGPKRRNSSFNPRRPPLRRDKNPDKEPPVEVKPVEEVMKSEMAVNKYVALSGICSRRKAVEYIEKGDVKINDVVATKPFQRVQPGDIVKYKDKVITPESKKQYILLNKPKNCITSLVDPEGRMTVMDVVKDACTERIFPVGRLDRNTTGLLVLTNDGDLAKKLSHPSSNSKKLYYATLDKPVLEEHVDQILAGLELEDGKAEVDACGFVDGSKGYEVGVEIHIGKNRIVRRLFEHFGYDVKRLDRMYYAGLTKKDLPRGRWRHLSQQEIIMLKHFTS